MPTTRESGNERDGREQYDRICAAVRDYKKRRGWKPVPIPAGHKHPTRERWQLEDHSFDTWDSSVGIQFGKPSGGLLDIDLDCEEARKLATYFLPETGAVFGRFSSQQSHWLYVSDLWKTAEQAATQFHDIKAKGDHGTMLLELRTGRIDKDGVVIGALSVFPPSLHHPSGEVIRWDLDGAPAEVDGEELKSCAATLAAAALLVRHYPPLGKRQEAALTLGGWLARARWDEDRIANFVEAVARIANDPEWQKRVDSAADAVDRLAAGKETTGLPRMRQVFGDAIVDKLADWLDMVAMDMEGSSSPDPAPVHGVSLDDFYAFMPTHAYIFIPTRDIWAAGSVNAQVQKIRGASGKLLKATEWLDNNRAAAQMTWAPGLPLEIEDRLVAQGGWIERKGVTCLNRYLPPTLQPDNADAAMPWVEHVYKVYPEDAEHIIAWCAHRVQEPQEKVNHALVLGGRPGIGKDTLLEPVKRAVGPWNFHEVSPQQLLGRFNGFLKSVILRVSEARDLGDMNRYQFYDHMKAYTAAPPDVLRVDEKHTSEYYILNVCGVVITSNHKTDGIYLPEDDRRHYVAWSDLHKEEFSPEYWTRLYRWYDSGGDRDVFAYLAALDLSGFNAKAPPPKTAAFWDIVAANRAPEEPELADALDQMGNPPATTLGDIFIDASPELREFLRERKNQRAIPHRMESCGYVRVRNDSAKDGLWKIEGRRQAIYCNSTLTADERVAAAEVLWRERSGVGGDRLPSHGPLFTPRSRLVSEVSGSGFSSLQSSPGGNLALPRTPNSREVVESKTTDFTDQTRTKREQKQETDRLRRMHGDAARARLARLRRRERDPKRSPQGQRREEE
jgi:hypothetical protein